jgi:hypothetical protein
MAHIYLLFAFATDEEKARLARHKLDTWKQAFRLDKKLLYKVERTAADSEDVDAKSVKAEEPQKKSQSKSKAAKPETEEAPKLTEDIRLLVRLGFSGHEKLSEQRWLKRIPIEEPFKDASPVVVKPGEAKFEATEQRFEELV